MKITKTNKHLYITEYWHRFLSILLCLTMVSSVFTSFTVFSAEAFGSSVVRDGEQETREETKARLMKLIKSGEFDPYSADMTVEEFFALMELFDEGKLPLNGASTFASINAVEANTDSYIPRTKFLFGGLTDYVPREGSNDNDPPLPYENGTDYTTDDEYPSGLDPFSSGYLRPPKSWDGVQITDKKTDRVVLVSEGTNDGDPSIAGDVIQDLFAKYTGYYVKQVTIDGANINVLGMIDLGDRCIYYYLSAEEQNTQVSTTTLPDEAKFIVEYVPVEHTVNYVVKMDGSNDPITYQTPENVVFFGSNSPTTLSWVDSIFSASRPHRTTDGAYSFDVFVPYGYELQIFISIDMTVDIPYSRPTTNNFFHVDIDHTSKKEDVKAAWLKAYSDYLNDEGFIQGDVRDYITETNENGKITLTWKNTEDSDAPAHNAILARMAERINDFVTHNNGYPLGRYPDYTEKGEGGFKILPDPSKSPTEHTMNDTFYNHLVKADRTITAVLKKQEAPTFDVSRILQKSDGAGNRGSSATEDFAFASLEHYDEDYKYHVENGPTQNRDGDPLTHSAVYPNIQSEKNAWEWGGENDSFRGKPQKMKYDAETGTYSYTWLFQTNSREGGYYLDAFEVNGIPISVPFYPKYNWSNSYVFQDETEIADKKHPYYTETTLADGAILKLEFLLGWNSNPPQRHYRVTVTGARSNVVITGLNLMTGTGAPEFVTYNLVGVYSNQNGESQTAPAIEYYAQTGGWTRKAQANVIVDSDNLGIDYSGGDTDKYGANIRFKITEGYGNPYYSWTNRHGDVINGQASVTLDNEWNVTSTNEIKSLKDVGEGKKLSSQYIYDGEDGYYYIRVTNQDNNTPGKNVYRFALLTVVAHTIKYTVRYTPEYDPKNGETPWNGFVIDPGSGEMKKLTEDFDPANIMDLDLDSMPTYNHEPDVCALYEMAKDETGTVPEIYRSILHQYDDNEGPFYDLIFNTMATIANNTYGTISPKDKNKNYTFMNWVVVGEDFTPVQDEDGNYIQFRSGAIDFTQYAHYAVKHTAFGNADTDIHVLRLMPVWRPINNPFTYNVVLNWVDNLGNIHADRFNDYWDEVVTEMTVGGQVYVFFNKDAKPLRDWIANHPTYNFWNDVNNATTQEEIGEALQDYLIDGNDNKNYDEIFEALLVGTNYEGTVNPRTIEAAGDEASEWTDVFERLGRDVFIVKKDGGEIGIWMCEDKGGLIFHKDVLEEPFIPDDEFYFTITDAKTGDGFKTPLSGKYNAYPQFVYDEDGNPRDRTDDDAWLVEFKNGEIVSINGDEKVTYFTLKDGDGISLYVSDGRYTVAELGSKSGSPYKTSVTYASTDGSGPKEGWILPKDGQLVGSEKSVNSSDKVKQVTATVDFEIGEHNVVQTLTFANSTLSMRINCEVLAPAGNSLWTHNFGYQLQFTLPDGETPLQDDAGNYYYNVTAYRKTVDAKGKIKYVATSGKLRMMSETQIGTRALGDSVSPFDVGNNVWYGALDSSSSAFTLKGDDYYVIVLPAPSDSDSTVSYTAIETKPTNGETWHLDGDAYSRSGELKLGVQAVETYINTVNDPSIYVTKRVVRSDGKQETGSFTFTVTLSDTTYSDDNFTNGVATFSLKDGESMFLVLNSNQIGNTYTVTEAPSSDYAANSTNASGTIVDGSMITVSFVNTQITPGPGYLVITETGGKKGETFLYKITDENGRELIVSVTIGEDGTGKTIVLCPSGYYTVEEITDWAWRYEDGECKQTMPIYVNNSHTLESPAHADFTNKRNSKVWLGGENRKNNLFVFHKKEEEETD